MKNININFDLKSLAFKLRNNTGVFLYMILGLLFFMELTILYSSVSQILRSRQQPEGLIPSRGVRFNFTEYDAAAKRISEGKDYFPKEPIYDNPFGRR